MRPHFLLLILLGSAGHAQVSPLLFPPEDYPALGLPIDNCLMLKTNNYFLVSDLTELRLSGTHRIGPGQGCAFLHHLGIEDYSRSRAGIGYALPLNDKVSAGLILRANLFRYAGGIRGMPLADLSMSVNFSEQLMINLALHGIGFKRPELVSAAEHGSRLTLIYAPVTDMQCIMTIGMSRDIGLSCHLLLAHSIQERIMLMYETGFNPFTQGCGMVFNLNRLQFLLGFRYTGGIAFHPQSGMAWSGL